MKRFSYNVFKDYAKRYKITFSYEDDVKRRRKTMKMLSDEIKEFETLNNIVSYIKYIH
jgi:hypothetical protein